ncbi:hypothetical protein O181_074250 [Austropuccinia psidii MF-1]|uniref:Uncharacterized protein n=1 Tax=Austropuccinia psidii MF-1 TaxID=1389203 RepID=A0A9Q3ICT9_9BASI|nr:hypothetical protein [Austropuccinia psidii MF-1]
MHRAKPTKSPIPSLPCEQTLQKPTPGPSVTQWLEDSCRGNKKTIPFLFSTFDSSELTLPPFVEPSQPDEPPISGLSQPSEPPPGRISCQSSAIDFTSSKCQAG